MADRIPKTYADVMDEFLAWNASAGAQAPKFSSAGDYAKYMDGREGGDYRKAAYDPNLLQQLNNAVEKTVDAPVGGAGVGALGMPLTGMPATGALSEGTQALGQVAGGWIDKLLGPSGPPKEQFDEIDPTGLLRQGQPTPQSPSFEDALGGVGKSMPRMVGQVAAMMTPAAPLAYADSALAAYGPNKDVVAAAIAPATLWAGGKVIPMAGRLGESMASKAVGMPVQELVQMPSSEYGTQVAKMLAPNAVQSNLIAASRIGSEVAAGTAVGEGSRMVSEAAHGQDVKVFDPVSMAANAVQSLAFAPLDVATRVPPERVRQEAALAKVAEADKRREQVAKLNDSRGARIGDAHKAIMDAARNGEDPTPAIAELKSHWQEADAARKPTAKEAGDVLMTTADDANSGRMSELDLVQVMNAVRGRFDEIARNDPEASTPGTVSGQAIADLVKQGLLPRITDDFLSKNFDEAYQQALGNEKGTSANLVNRIVAHYQEVLPGALEARSKLPTSRWKEGPMTKTELDATQEGEKDAAYMQSLIKLMPHMKGKKAPSADPKNADDLDTAVINRDVEMSSATQGNQLQAESRAWAVYDTWKDSIIRLAETYDPVTRTGEWRPSKRMADGTVIEGSAQRMSLEDLVEREADKGRYKVNVMAKRKIGQSVPTTSLDEMLQYVSDKFGSTGDENQDTQMLRDPSVAEKFQRKRSKFAKDASVNPADEARLDKIGATREADEAGLVGDEKEQYIKKTIAELSESNAPMFGFDLKATNREDMYDIALYLAKKVEETPNELLWKQYGGEKVFGKGATAPGKAELFRDAILAKIESDMDDTGKLTVAQKRFYEAWRTQANLKEGTASEVPKSWEAQRAQFRHALRLYWRQVGELAPGSGKAQEFFISLLDDKPDYQNMLRAGGARVGKMEGAFVADAPRLLSQLGRGGFGTNVDKEGAIPARSVKNLLSKMGVTAGEMSLYESQGLDKFLGQGKVKVDDLQRWLSDKAPKVEVKKLEPERIPEQGTPQEADRRSAIQHAFETEGYDLVDDYDTIAFDKDGVSVEYRDLPDHLKTLADELETLVGDRSERGRASDAATGQYGVEPKALSDMPGAVDILVRLPSRAGHSLNPEAIEPMFRGPHFGESDKNVLASVRGYEETLPNGKKAFHVFEVQSDWGQKRTQYNQSLKEFTNKGGKKEDFAPRGTYAPDHPLLAHYESLALKAAIEHAKSIGADYIALSDAETAMMTEGHDSYAASLLDSNSDGLSVPQESGMRAAYDVRLPASMEKLTEEKGTTVSFGTHGAASSGSRPNSVEDIVNERVGSPVFKDAKGKPKTEITARLYDISKLPSTGDARMFGSSRFNTRDDVLYTSPVPIPGGRVAHTQAAGQSDPVTDSLRLFRGYGRKLGMSEADADNYSLIAAKFQQAFSENSVIGRAITPENYQGFNVPGDGQDRPWVAINFDAISQRERGPTESAVRALQVLAHELAHNYTHPDFDNPSLYRLQRQDAYAKLEGLFKELGPEATNDLLNNVIDEVFIPPQFALSSKTNLIYPGSNFGAEAVSKMMEYSVLGAFTRNHPASAGARKSAEDMDTAFLWLPQDVQAFTKFAFRDVANFVGGLEDYYSKLARVNNFTREGDSAAKVRAYLRPMMQFANEFLAKSVERDAQYESVGKGLIAKLNASGSADWNDPIVIRSTRAMDIRELQQLTTRNKISYNIPEGEDPFGFEGMQQELFPKPGTKAAKFQTADQKRLGAQVPAWSHWLGQLYQAMRRYERVGVQLADPATRLLNDLEPSYWRLTQELHAPFTMVDDKGDIKYDPNHPVQLLLRNNHPQSKRGLQVMEELRQWSQDNQKAVVTKDDRGRTIVDPAAQEKVRTSLAGLAPEVQQGVLEGISSLVDGYRRSAELRYGAELESVSTQVAKFFMMKDKGLFWDKAFALGQVSTNAAVTLERARQDAQSAQANFQKAQEKLQGQQVMGQSPELMQAQVALQSALQNLKLTSSQYAEATRGLTTDQVSALENYVLGPGGVAGGLINMADMFKARQGWFMSEARPGRYLTFAKTPEGESYANGRRDHRAAAALEKELAGKGYTDVETVDREAQDSMRVYDSPDAVVNGFIKLEQGAWQKFLKGAQGLLSEEDYAALTAEAYTPGMASQKFVENKSLDRYMQQRKSVAGREDLDSFEVFTDYTRRMVGTVSRRGLRQQMDLLLRDPRARKQGEFQQTLREAVNTLMQPVSDDFMTARSAITAMFLGMPNIVSPMVESTQMLTTIFPELVREGKSYTDAVRRFTQAFGQVFKYDPRSVFSTMEVNRLVQQARDKELVDPRTMTKEESMAYYMRRSHDEGRFSHGVAQQNMLARDAELLGQWAFGMGLGGANQKSVGELAKDSVYWASQLLMKPYSKVSGFGNQMAFMSALDMFYDQGFRGRELYEKAHVFKDRATFGGGKPNEVGYVGKLSNPRTRSWFSLINTLQRYSFGSMTQLKDYVADMTGKTNLPARDRVAAGKAFTQAMAAQVVFAGAMGVPGSLLVATVLQKMTGFDLKQKAREFWFDLSKRLGADDPMAVLMANVAQNGVGGQFLGMDLSSRFTVNSFMGFDAFEGFDTTNLLGPPAGVIERLVKAGQYAAQGKMVQATKQALPPSLTPLVDLTDQVSDYGQAGIRGAGGQLLAPMTPGEQARYAIGIRPYKYRLFRDQQQALKLADQGYQNVRSQQVDAAADALNKGNSKPTFEWVREYMKRAPGSNLSEAVQSVVNRALVQTNAQDLLATGLTGNDERAREVAKTFGDAAPRQSEMGLLMQKDKLNALTGFAGGPPASSKEMVRASLVDALVKAKGMTKGEASRLVDLMGY